jgi:uncharacterized protein with von Willebrand factor type A (vWA) domain
MTEPLDPGQELARPDLGQPDPRRPDVLQPDLLSGPDRIVAGFGRALRGAGVAVPTGALVTYSRALGAVGLDDPDHVYWAGRATLIRRHEDIPAYDRVFSSYWRSAAVPGQPAPVVAVPVTLAVDDEDAEGDDEDLGEPGEDDGQLQVVRYSAVEILRQRDLASLTNDEWAEAQRLISAMRIAAEVRPSRRTRPSRRRAGGDPDLRRTVRRNIPTGGVPIRRSWRIPVERPRRMVFLLDVSGSMEPYARSLARFAHAAVLSRNAGQVEVFTLGTRLTRVSREMTRRDPDAALSAVTRAVSDWSGGTRIGDSLRQFNDRWGVRGMARGAIVVICSDGWDRGDPEVVDAEMARLSRVARRVVWVNPLKASPGYAPLARGMAAALPYVDLFVEGHSVASLEHLARLVAGGRAVKENQA